MNRVAVLEDHERMASLLKKALLGASIEVDIFTTVSQAVHAVNGIRYAAWIIDRNLPDGDGIDFLRGIRAQGHAAPALILTARDALNDRIEGLESGADDYMVKPFEMAEFVARVRALLRRPAQTQELDPHYNGLQILAGVGLMNYREESISLAPAEVQLMLTLVRAAGSPVRRTALEAAAWGHSEAVTPNALDVAIHRLRRKLIGVDAPVVIRNVRALGYALAVIDGIEG